MECDFGSHKKRKNRIIEQFSSTINDTGFPPRVQIALLTQRGVEELTEHLKMHKQRSSLPQGPCIKWIGQRRGPVKLSDEKKT